MTLKTKLLATTAALVVAGGAAFADAHATHPVTGETLASDQSFTYRDLEILAEIARWSESEAPD